METNTLKFKKGRGFYQLNKPELIQDYKEVIVRRKSDGKIVTGDSVREVLGIPKAAKKFKLDLAEISDFDVFVQSTSVNRMLLPDTEFLYEVDEEEATVSLETLPAPPTHPHTLLSSAQPVDVVWLTRPPTSVYIASK